MPTIKDLKQQIKQTESIKLITQALAEIAAIKLKTTKSSVEKNIRYFSEISRVYHAVKLIAARKRIESIKTTQDIYKGNKRNQNLDKFFYKKNGKTVSIILSSNYRFYGGLDDQLMNKYIILTSKYPTDRIIIGKFAKDYLSSIAYNRPYQIVLFKTDFPTQVELKGLIDKIINYSRIFVFHSKFLTILKQTENISDLSESSAEVEASKTRIDYILEPEIDKMLLFFESQILILLFQSILLQSQLARTAARMISMYDAEAQAEKIINRQKLELAKSRVSLENIRILETFAGLKSILDG